MAKDGLRLIALTLLACNFGCSGKSDPPYPDFAPPIAPQAISSDNGFGLYVQAADDAEVRGAAFRTRVAFAQSDKAALFAATDAAIKLLGRASAVSVSFVYTPRKPFVAAPHQVGWRLIGRSLASHIAESCQAANFSAAIDYLLLATTFGLNLVGGDATDATLGLIIADDARKALLEHLTELSPSDLARLAAGLQKDLHQKPDLGKTISNEKQNMLMAIQYVQDAYRADNYDVLLKKLGADVRDAVKHLQNEVKPKDRTERPKYFEGFFKEAEAEAKWETEVATDPSAKIRLKAPDAEGDRPWKRWSKHFFQSARPLLAMYDATIARTRLLALTSMITAQKKTKSKVPSTLAEFEPDLIQDPFSGGTFIYHSQGMEFRIYSVGRNMRDDGGHSDGSYNEPDLTLEVRD